MVRLWRVWAQTVRLREQSELSKTFKYLPGGTFIILSITALSRFPYVKRTSILKADIVPGVRDVFASLRSCASPSLAFLCICAIRSIRTCIFATDTVCDAK
eukprot:3935190-Rhodomonas_salina.1